MNVIILALFSYIFNPSVSQMEQDKLIQKFNINFVLKRTPKINFDEKKLINLYNKGKYKKYIKEFNSNINKFIYVRTQKINYNKLYLYYTLSLKILNQKTEYLQSLCLIRGALNSFENLPPFILGEMPEKCKSLKEISIVENKNLRLYINGLPIESDYVFTSDSNYNLTICKDNTCRYLRTKASKIDKLKYNDDGSVDLYFGPKLPNGAPESNYLKTVPGKGWFTLLRLYSPSKPFFDQTWRPGDFEKIN